MSDNAASLVPGSLSCDDSLSAYMTSLLVDDEHPKLGRKAA
jgi:hypothetical protein